MLSLFGRLSIRKRRKNGELLVGIMESADKVSKIKNQNNLAPKDEAELKESVYGKTFYYYCITI